MHGAMEKIKVNREIVLFNEDIVGDLMQLPKESPSLMGVKKLKDIDLHEIFRKNLMDVEEANGFVIKKAKGFWRYYLKFFY